MSIAFLVAAALGAGALPPSALTVLDGVPTAHDRFLAAPSLAAPRLTLAAGESRALALRWAGPATTFAFDPEPLPGVTVELFRVAWIPGLVGADLLADPLIPVAPGTAIRDQPPWLLWLRVTADEAAAGGVEVVIQPTGEGQDRLRLPLLVLPWSIPRSPLTVQAAVWSAPPDGAADYDLALLRLLRGYGVTGIGGGWSTIDIADPDGLCDRLELLFDELGFTSVRLPVPADLRFNVKTSFTGRFGDAPQRWREWQERWCATTAGYARAVLEPTYRDRLSLKIWDEPRLPHLDQVARLYELARPCTDGLRLELTGIPTPELVDTVDIWILPIKYLDPADVAAQRAAGRTQWLYANRLHWIDQPPHALRAVGWLLWHLGLDGYHFWAINAHRVDPWSQPSSMRIDYRRSGVLVYTSPETGLPVPSLRLESFREGLEDLRWIRAVTALAEADPVKERRAAELVATVHAALDAWNWRKESPADDFPAWRERAIAIVDRARRTAPAPPRDPSIIPSPSPPRPPGSR